MLACGLGRCSLWGAIKSFDTSKQVGLLADYHITVNAASILRWPAWHAIHLLGSKGEAGICRRGELAPSSACHVHSREHIPVAFRAADRRGFQSAESPVDSCRQESLAAEIARASAAQKRPQQYLKAAVWQPTRLQLGSLHSNAGSDLGWIRHQHVGTAPLWQQTQSRLFRPLRAPPTAPKSEMYLQLRKDEPVRLVAADGSHRVLQYGAALEEARNADADLIMVARHADPPVMKLGEAQRALFKQRQKEKELKRRQLESRRSQAVKEVRIGSKIAEHDLERQLKLARGFVEKGYKVKVLVVFQRRLVKEGISKLEDIKQRAQDWAAVAAPAANERVMANTFAVMLTPRASATAEA